MDYGISLGISCFGKVRPRTTCSLQAKCDLKNVGSVPLNCLLFSGSHFVLQLPVSCQDVWGRHVNTQLCTLTSCVSHVEVHTVKRGCSTVSRICGLSSGHNESPLRLPLYFWKKHVTAAVYGGKKWSEISVKCSLLFKIKKLLWRKFVCMWYVFIHKTILHSDKQTKHAYSTTHVVNNYCFV